MKRALVCTGLLLAPFLRVQEPLMAQSSPLALGSYFGGRVSDQIVAVVGGADGSIIVAGNTSSPDLPTTTGAFQTSYPGAPSGFVAKISAQGRILFTTYIGPCIAISPNFFFVNNCISAVALDSAGNVYVTGGASNSAFPVTTQLLGGGTAFVVKLNSVGGLVYSALFGGNGSDGATGIQIDAAGNAYVVGTTYSTNFPGTPTLPVCTQACSPIGRVFVAKIAPTGASLVYSFILAGSYFQFGEAIALDGSGSVYVTGRTGSVDFPVTAGAYQTTLNAGVDVFVSKLDPTGTKLLYSTFLGGGIGTAIAVDQAGNVYVAGETNSQAFLSKINPSGSGLVYSTYLGGSGAETVSSIAVDKLGRLLVTGQTTSTDFPVTQGALPVAKQAQFYTYLAALNASGTALVFGTYLGGTDGEVPGTSGVMVDTNDLVTVAGSTNYPDIPITLNAPQPAPLLPNILTGFIVQLQLASVLNAPILNGIVNAASFSSTALSPGTIVTLFGSGLGPSPGVGPVLNAAGRISTQLSNTRVLFDGQPIPLLYVGEGQINAVLPVDKNASAAHKIVVLNGSQASNALPLTIADVSPGLFTVGASGTGAAALNYDAKNGSVSLNSPTNPASKASIITLWTTGGGATNPPWTDGAIVSNPLPLVQATVVVLFDGRAGQVLYAGGAPGEVTGVVQINVRIPDAVASGSAVPINLEVGGVSSQSGVTVAIQ